MDTGTRIRTIKAHAAWVSSVAFSPYGKTIASGGEGFDSTIRLWDVNTGTRLRTITDTSVPSSVVFSPDGKTIASGSGDGSIHLWDVNTGTQLLHIPEARFLSVSSVVFSPDGKTIASGSFYIHLWDAGTGTHLRRLRNGNRHVYYTIDPRITTYGVAFSPDGKMIAGGNFDGNIRLWDANTGSLLHTFKGGLEWVYSVAFSPDGKTLASGSRSGTLFLWDVLSILLPADVNGDGVVNIQDLVAVAQAFGEAEPDLNGDGVVNIQDLVIVANAFGNTVSAPEE